ncbi:hypothetical protein Pmani_026096 [Petrolisthes manimaculis]|uniref:Uncharacterized protein n=1 Tax=Petrolisthes manimaculis TaxID=1843537 RepID=A0AAE1TWZ9_9EUCA|nr:hypothetical protein Pmani_026096 [Petrolisthes manimaculis]
MPRLVTRGWRAKEGRDGMSTPTEKTIVETLKGPAEEKKRAVRVLYFSQKDNGSFVSCQNIYAWPDLPTLMPSPSPYTDTDTLTTTTTHDHPHHPLPLSPPTTTLISH